MSASVLPISTAPRFFEVDDGGASYSIVANDLEHAKQILRDSGCDLTTEDGDSAPIDDPRFAKLEWVELSADAAAKVRVMLGDGGAPPSSVLAACKVGDWFTSEY